MAHRTHRLILLGMLLVVFNAAAVPATYASGSHPWKPYLQQLTDTSVIIVWSTVAGERGTVRYGTDRRYRASATGTTRPFPALHTQLHSVALTGLQPDTLYYYQVLTDGKPLAPEETRSFRTAPETGSSTPFSFLVFGDYGQGTEAQRQLRDQMRHERFNLILTTGDNSYPSGSYHQLDANVFQVYAELFARAPVYPSIGNHDTYTNGGGPLLDAFELPRNAWRAKDAERYYSFDHGNVHFVVLDSTASLKVKDQDAHDDMLDWLRDDLRRTPQPWKIVVSHHPAYSSGTNHGADERSRSLLAPIYEEYGVALVLSGDDHIYLRTKPLRHGQVAASAADGVTYVVTGAGSQASYGCRDADYVAARQCSKQFGIYTRVSVSGSCLSLRAIRETGAVLDRASVCR